MRGKRAKYECQEGEGLRIVQRYDEAKKLEARGRDGKGQKGEIAKGQKVEMARVHDREVKSCKLRSRL